MGSPSKTIKPGDIKKFLRGAVGFRCIKNKVSLESYPLLDSHGKFFYGTVFSGSHVYKTGGWIVGQVFFNFSI